MILLCWWLLSTFWGAVTAGAYTVWGNPATYELGDPLWGLLDSSVPARLQLLHDFMTRFPYWEMEPVNDAVSPNEVQNEGVGYRTNFCLAKVGECYLAYSLHGGSLTFALPPSVRYRLTQWDPRTGDETDLGQVDGDVQVIWIKGRQEVIICQQEA